MPHLEHIGIAVEDPKAVAQMYEKLLGVQPYKQEGVEREGVLTHFISAGTAKLELLEAVGADLPVAKYLEKRGEGLHHLAFEVDDVRAHMAHLRAQGFTPLSDEPRPGADGKLIFFLHPKQTHGVLVEFCQSTPAPLAATDFPYRGGTLAAYERGHAANPPLVVLHGFGGQTRSDTEAIIRRLEQHFRVLALDLAGHGDSDAFEDEAFTLDFFADNVRALLDHFAVRETHLFGFSLGGLVALHFALGDPARVNRLAVHATRLAWDADAVSAFTTRLDVEEIDRRPALIERLEPLHRDWRGCFARTALLVRSLPTQRMDFTQLNKPVLVSACDRDVLAPPSEALALQQALPEARLALLPGTDHALPARHAGMLAALLHEHTV